MRLHRVRVEHFRGIDAQEVTFAASGVTVVEAPNETGKSSLLEAVQVLFGYKDSSTAQAVRDVRPVGRDVGSLVEVELSCGDYRLTCRKRFHRERLTELTISEPAAEQHRGDEAHERLQQILDAHVDRALLSALWFAQGEAMRQVALRDSHTLAHALDHVAGSSAAPHDDGLFEAVAAERQQWFTPKAGSPHKHLRQLGERVAALDEQIAELRRRLAALERDVDRSAGIDRELARLAQRRAELAPEVEAYQRQLEHITQLRAAVQQHRQQAELAESRRDAAQSELARRGELEASVEATRAKLGELDAAVHAGTGEVDRLAQQASDLGQRRDAAEAHAGDARRAAKRARDDVALLTDQRVLDERRGIQHRIADADADAQEAEAFLAACELTDARLDAIDEAHHDLRVAEARVEAGAPTLSVEALDELALTVDDEPASLPTGERRELTVAEPTHVTIGAVARVTVRPGTSLSELADARREAAARRQHACEAGGVADRAEAHDVARRRREAESTVGRRDERVAELLGDATRESLAEEIRDLATRVEGRLGSRPDEDPLPSTLDEAVARRDAADEAGDTAERDLADARAAVEALEPRLAAAREQLVEQQTRRQTAAEQLGEHEAALAGAREHQADEELAAARDAHEQDRTDAAAAQHEASRELDEAQPEQVELLADNAAGQLRDIDAELEALRTERVEVRARLDAAGEEGLGERLEETEAARERAARERDREWRRANAAKLLHDVMAEERERAQAAYRQPLTAAIERLGRLVYDDSFAVEVDENLSVARRTLDGGTVAWEQLSGGAKEQLAILSALACGTLIDEGGAPLVLDDALGFTDPDRLERMSAVLATAGRDCQVIVLTCTADRYRHVAGATTRRLLAPTPSTVASSAEATPRYVAASTPRARNGSGPRRRRCGVCHQEGHNARTCAQRAG